MFSVVIPLYNKEDSIKNTIQSVLGQNYKDFEIVIVNDGSTDKSTEVVKSFHDTRIRLIHQKNQGVSAARNKGIKEAKFEWICFLDADDLWKTYHLSEILKMMHKFPKENVFVTSFEFSDQRHIKKIPRENDIFKIENYFKEALQEHLITTNSIVVKRNCFDKVGLFNVNLNRGEDLDMWARLAKEFDIIKSQKTSTIYRLGVENSSSFKKRSKYEQSLLSIIELEGKTGYEKHYFKRMLLKRLKSNFKSFHIKENFKIILKHNFQLF